MQSDFHRMKNFANPKSMFKVNIKSWFSQWIRLQFAVILILFFFLSYQSSTVSAGTEQANANANTVAPGRPDPTPTGTVAAVPATEVASKKEEAKDVADPQSDDGAVRTEHLFKHPLQNTWTLWYLENDRTKSWEDMLNEITSFDTVEDFWSLYNHIKPPSEIKLGSDYSLFKKGIR